MKAMKSGIRDAMRIDWDVPITLDDGLVLRADVFRPIADGRYSAIVSYGPYGKGHEVDGNDFEQFKAAVADVMVPKGANDNVVIGTNGSVSDLGAGNEIRGLKRLAK